MHLSHILVVLSTTPICTASLSSHTPYETTKIKYGACSIACISEVEATKYSEFANRYVADLKVRNFPPFYKTTSSRLTHGSLFFISAKRNALSI